MNPLRRLRYGLNPLVLQVTSVVVAGLLVIGTVLFTSGVVERSSRDATDNANAALLAAQLASRVDEVLLLRLDDASTDETRAIPLSDAIAAHDLLRSAHDEAVALHELIGSASTLQIWGATGEAASTLDRYLDSESAADFRELQIRLEALRALTSRDAPMLTAAARDNQATLTEATRVARIALITIALLAVAGITGTTLIIGKRLRRAVEQAESEKAALMRASKAMARRNDQFTALYQVVSEVTETLSMKYVVATTLKEARKLAGADVVALRLLQNDDLSLLGTEQDIDADIEELTSIKLGAGIVGRAAKRGKTVRIERNADMVMTDGERVLGVESGIIVPLIVGARVVGTLECWSRRPDVFGADDERILEMMASQVATAIIAANVHEATEREAHHDALTSLPNRRQLSDDLRGPLLEATIQGAPMAIAMVDIDHFKRFNDDYGHKVGDVTLQKVAEVLRSSVRQGDRVYRFGGEEFLIVFAGSDAQLAGTLAERVRAAVERTTLTGEQMEPVGPITISVGVALHPQHGTHMEELIDVADRAMYASKEMGRNRVTVAGVEPEPLALAA